MKTKKLTYCDLFKVASRTVKLIVIACKLTLFLSSVTLLGFVPVINCLIKYIRTVPVVWLTAHLCHIEKHVPLFTGVRTLHNRVKHTWYMVHVHFRWPNTDFARDILPMQLSTRTRIAKKQTCYQ